MKENVNKEIINKKEREIFVILIPSYSSIPLNYERELYTFNTTSASGGVTHIAMLE